MLELSRVRRRKAKPTDDKPRAMSSLNIARARRRKTKSNLTKKDAEERVKDQKVKMQHTTMLCSSVSDSLSVTGLDDIGYGQDDATGLEADTRKENGWGTGW